MRLFAAKRVHLPVVGGLYVGASVRFPRNDVQAFVLLMFLLGFALPFLAR